MNCRDFRRHLLIDPFSADTAFVSHAAKCEDCADAMRRARDFETKLRTALAEAAESDRSDTTERRAGGPPPTPRFGLAPWFLGAFALLVLVLGVGSRPWLAGWPPATGERAATNSPLGAAVLAHIESEAAVLDADPLVPEPALDPLFGSLGIQVEPAAIDQELRPLRYAARCWIRQGEAVHLVLTGETGPLTLLLMPDERLEAPEPIRSAHFRGLMVPAGSGSLAVIGEPAERVTRIARRLQGLVTSR